MQVVILAGGLGKRLRPLTEDIPKSMVPVLNRPYLEYQIKWLNIQGITDILILIGYLGEKIKAYFQDGASRGVKITYSQEPKLLGTGGGLKLAEAKLEKYFALIYGDSFLPLDFVGLEDFFLSVKKTGVIVVYDNGGYDTQVLNNIQLAQDSSILRYRKNSCSQDFNFVEAGVMVFSKDITGYIPENTVASLEEDTFPLLIKKKALSGYVSKEPFYDIGTPERLRRFEEMLRTNKLLALTS